MKPALALTAILPLFLGGCSDPTYEHRKALAIDLTKAVAWQCPNIDSIPEDQQLLYVGMGRARAMAEALEASLESSPPFSEELLTIMRAHARSSRTLEAQFRSAIEDGRSDLNETEREIVLQCSKDQWILFAEILDRIKINELGLDVSQ